MTDLPPSDPTTPLEHQPDDRLDSWKEIAAYLRRDVKTVQRWEKREGMPIRRHVHDKIGSVYAFKTELDAWGHTRRAVVVADPEPEDGLSPSVGQSPAVAPVRRRWGVPLAIAAAATVLVVFAVSQFRNYRASPDIQLADIRFSPLTDFDGIEQAAAVSGDGRFVAFLSDRDGQMDVWITQVGTGQFYNLTRGAADELVNPSVRTLGFSPDGSLVTFWRRRHDMPPDRPAISVWAVPVLGGAPRPYLEGAAELDWTTDGRRVVYHTPGPGDPIYVRDAGRPAEARQIFSAPPGLHSHFVSWSPGQEFIYFVQGSLPDRLDIWRIRSSGGPAERITQHASLVSHPVFLSDRTLLYLASDPDASGPWIHRVDVERRLSRRVSVGPGRYTSLAASADGRRLVATLASPKSTLWRLPFDGARAEIARRTRIALTTGNGAAPRLGADYLVYVSSKGSGDSLWKLRNGAASELWSAPDARIIGKPAIAPDGRRVAFSIRQRDRTLLYVANADGTEARVMDGTLHVQGAPAWTPDGRAITVAAMVDDVPRLFTVPLDGGRPAALVHEYSVDPVWSPDGQFVVFSGPDIGTTFEVKAVRPDGQPYPLPKLALTRGSKYLCPLPGRRLIVLRGDIGHKNLWQIDLAAGAEQQLTDVAPDIDLRDFDVSADGREIVLEQVHEQSDIVLIEIPRSG